MMEVVLDDHPLTDYQVYKQVTKSTYSTVRKAKKDGRYYAIKETIPSFLELDIFTRFKHRRIIKMIDYRCAAPYDHPDRKLSLYIIMEWADIALINYQSPILCTRFIRDMIVAINLLHQNGVVHGDVNLSNFVLVDDEQTYKCKLIDFSNSYHIDDPPTLCQSRTYAPPEIQNRYYHEQLIPYYPYTSLRASDLWALGVTIFEYLVKWHHPNFTFSCRRYLQIRDAYFLEYEISRDWHSLLRLLLDVDPDQRILNMDIIIKSYQIESCTFGVRPLWNASLDKSLTLDDAAMYHIYSELTPNCNEANDYLYPFPIEDVCRRAVEIYKARG